MEEGLRERTLEGGGGGGTGFPRNCALLLCLCFPWAICLALVSFLSFAFSLSFASFLFLSLRFVLMFPLGGDGEKENGVPALTAGRRLTLRKAAGWDQVIMVSSCYDPLGLRAAG